MFRAVGALLGVESPLPQRCPHCFVIRLALGGGDHCGHDGDECPGDGGAPFPGGVKRFPPTPSGSSERDLHVQKG
jgi:hypothetical protein